MKQRRIARNHLYAGGSCWPSNFGLVTSEPRLRSFHSCSSTMQCPARLSVTRQGARSLKRAQIVPSRGSKVTGLFLIFCTAVECKFSKLYFLPQLAFISLSTFVKILNLARPCIFLCCVLFLFQGYKIFQLFFYAFFVFKNQILRLCTH